MEKVFYRPIEAAVRWCNLIVHEAQILEATWDYSAQLSERFPQWPCLFINTEKIFDAVRSHELPYGFFGATVMPGTPIDWRLLTVRHTDLKWWMLHHHPDQRPEFLFGETLPDNKHIEVDTYLTLKADRDALEVKLRNADATLQELLEELNAIGLERENLRSLAKKRHLSERSEATYQHIIGALIETLLGSSPALGIALQPVRLQCNDAVRLLLFNRVNFHQAPFGARSDKHV
ncbi:hypothetical protein [Pseudomonas syringae]|uniref:hypothetical protein n=1 Tax=Pseudomonas syringae TaxID=317 RepID=UPI001F0F7EC7|nr:hypothetical protein [Pseudomonas syringae]MCH5487725.1 hypothetical protein [Pseudomonas syringae pv. syringae]MDO1458868.1 hypothetical protein [Pseudomonas syringae pv. syringae]